MKIRTNFNRMTLRNLSFEFVTIRNVKHLWKCRLELAWPSRARWPHADLGFPSLPSRFVFPRSSESHRCFLQHLGVAHCPCRSPSPLPSAVPSLVRARNELLPPAAAQGCTVSLASTLVVLNRSGSTCTSRCAARPRFLVDSPPKGRLAQLGA